MKFEINGIEMETEADPSMRLIDFLRGNLHLTGTKEGCGKGECGACTVILNGKIVASCLVLLGQIEGGSVTTIEGLTKEGKLTDVQEAFIEEGAVQCGFCTPGLIVATEALLREKPNPSEKEIKRAIEGNLCRCTGYAKIIDAIIKASAKRRSIT